MTGSIKDRMALHILRKGYERGPAGPGRAHRGGHQRQHRHLLRGPGSRPGPSGHHLHAGLDEPGAQGPDPQPGRRHPPGEPRRGWLPGQHPALRGVRRRDTRAASCPASSPTRTTSRPTPPPPVPRSGGSCASRGWSPTPSWRASAPAAPSWASAATSSRCIQPCRSIPSSPPTPPRSPRAARWASTGSRASPTSSSRPS